MNSNSLDYYYNKALNSIKSLEYTSIDVQKFCFELKNFENQADDFKVKAGLFLSALINQSKEQKFLLDTTALSSKIHYLGYSNTKEIVVNGNVGNNLGSNMEKGKITVYGNAGTNVGYLMKGGEIYIEGQYQSIYPYLLGKVYHKNQLIFKDGKKLNDLANQKK
ncbi:MAG: hypothetical protein N3D10_00970 [Candidatus Micrarchaeota archaeon]|nr:hypothetical protein [Candidatus Micrarchaeota archaeon]